MNNTDYLITRETHGALTPRVLDHLARAWRTLHSGPFTTSPKLRMVIHGNWPDLFNGDGLWLTHNEGAEIIKIGREYVVIRYRDDDGEFATATVKLVPDRDSGFTRILFTPHQGGQK